MENGIGTAFDWDDEIEKESSDFTILPEGDYDFEVTDFERGRHTGSAKLPPCNKVTVYLHITSKEGATTIKHQLFLHSITEGMLCSFFRAIGQKKSGEKFKMNWSIVKGSKGRCKIYIDKYTNDKGEERLSNKIRKFYFPAEDDKPKQAFIPGSF